MSESRSPTDLPALIGFACEAVLYGSYCILFVVSWIVLGQKQRSTKLSSPVVFANCLLFFCCTAHFALEFNHFYTTLDTTGVDGYSAETPGLMGADFLISFTDLVGDLVLIYRCWMLWGKNYYVVILPLLSAFAGFACIMEVLHLVIVTDPTAPAPPPVTQSPVVIGQGASNRAMMLIIESGALYLMAQLVFVVLFAIEHPAMGIVAVIATQIYGIAPTLIIIRVSMGISSEHTTKAITSTRIEWIARPGADTGTSGTQFTVEHSMAETDMDIRMKDFDLTRMKGHDEIEIADVDMAPAGHYESASPV
ncbi:hypothetical protein BDR07DRAFT_1406526 [Suillus spraguei]|nr:hypothetical protein BDR07DRAFT_1406526 [Suillus spraguei]